MSTIRAERFIERVGEYCRIERQSLLGIPYEVWVHMPRIDDRVRRCVVYLYPSEEDAHNGVKSGGTGFFVTVTSRTGTFYRYVVTNRHVIREYAAKFIRVNTRERWDGHQHDVFQGEWVYRDDGDDIAACELDPPIEKFDFYTVAMKEAVTERDIKNLDIGVGEDLFMVGRFLNHDGKLRNLPTVRFGTIAMMPEEPIIDEGYPQDSFLAEIRTVPGYSGSPVFVHIPADRMQRPNVKVSQSDKEYAERFGFIDKFLGIEWCRLKGELSTVYINGTQLNAHITSGMSGIIPAWKIASLLDDERFKVKRDREDKHRERAAHGSAIEHTGAGPRMQHTTPQKGDPIEIPVPTRGQFERDLGKAMRKRKPS
jgi:hypothetical protein